MSSNASKLLGAKQRLTELAEYFDIRKKAAIIEDEENKDGHYVICGWMSEADVEQFLKEIKDDDRVMAVVEENKEKFLESHRPSSRIRNSSNRLRCSLRCTDFRRPMRWIRLCLWHSHIH